VVRELVGWNSTSRPESSDWGRVEELSDSRLAYAANDVRYLLPARDRLHLMLVREERLALAQRCFACIPVFSDLDRGQYGQIFEHR
jgi:ribonuclease D